MQSALLMAPTCAVHQSLTDLEKITRNFTHVQVASVSSGRKAKFMTKRDSLAPGSATIR